MQWAAWKCQLIFHLIFACHRPGVVLISIHVESLIKYLTGSQSLTTGCRCSNLEANRFSALILGQIHDCKTYGTIRCYSIGSTTAHEVRHSAISTRRSPLDDTQTFCSGIQLHDWFFGPLFQPPRRGQYLNVNSGDDARCSRLLSRARRRRRYLTVLRSTVCTLKRSKSFYSFWLPRWLHAFCRSDLLEYSRRESIIDR